MITRKFASVFLMVGLLSGCATQRFYFSGEPAVGGPSLDQMQSFFVGGIGQTKEINAKEICNGKEVSHVETELTFLDGFLAGVTYGIYTPHTARVYCKK